MSDYQKKDMFCGFIFLWSFFDLGSLCFVFRLEGGLYKKGEVALRYGHYSASGAGRVVSNSPVSVLRYPAHAPREPSASLIQAALSSAGA